jgi:PAS domain S-box-containing protein
MDKQKQLAENEFEAFFYNSPVVKLILDSERKIHYINLTGQRYAGRAEAELAGVRAGEALRCIHSADDPRGCGFGPACQDCIMRRIINETFEQHLSHYREQVTLSLGNQQAPQQMSFYVSSIPLQVKDQELILITLEDISERVAMENALRHSEQRYALAQRAANIGSWDWNVETGELFWSEQIEPIFGFRKGEFGGTYEAFLAAVHPDDRDLVVDSVNKAVNEGAEYAIEHRIIWSDGSVHWVSENGDVFRDGNGKAIRMMGIVQDITERKAVEDALRISEYRYGLAQKAAGLGLWDWDLESNRLYWSEDMLKILDMAGENQIRPFCNLCLLMHPDDVQQAQKAARDALYKSSEYAIEFRLELPDGRAKWIASTGIVTHDDKGKPIRVIGAIQDITEHKQLEDELRRRDLINSLAHYAARLGTWEWDMPDGAFHWSEQAAAIFGLSPREQGRMYVNAIDMVLPEDRKQVIDALQESARQQHDYHEIFRVLWPNGAVHWVESIGSIVPVGGGKSNRMVGAIQDITEHKMREESLKRDLGLTQALAKLSNLLISPRTSFQQLADLIITYAQIITDSEHSFVQTLDPATGNMIGHAATEMSARGCTLEEQGEGLIFPIGDDGQYPSLWGYALNTHKGFFTNDPEHHPAARGLPGGHIKLKNYLAVPAFMGTQLMGQIAVANSRREYSEDDLSAVTRLAELMALAVHRERNDAMLRKRTLELEETTRELKSSNADLEQFAYVASHDLQEPLRMIANYLQLLERRYSDKLDGDAKTFVDFAVDGAKRMQDLIDDLLEFSRIGSRGKPFLPTDMNEVVADAMKNIHLAIEQSKGNITVDALPTIMADRPQMVQLMQNLLSNALKFRGKDPLVIHITSRIENGMTVFSVKDNGIGIAPEHRERIFGIFQRLHTRAQYPGTGMGLAICERIVSRHRGKIWVESEEGKGSTFYFCIPLLKQVKNE